mmetsp:Transcript_19919/g.19944  ORF Transcript_19919/g.19944 Transcript_19919/m.19944 type:complete len:357 (-) Transcript_19919:29-1099(-)
MKIDQFMIPKNKIQRIVRDFSDDIVPNMRFKQDAYKAFQEAAEAYLIEVFTMSNDIADDNKRITVRYIDIQEAVKKIDNDKMDIEEEEEKKPKGRGRKQAVVKEESESEEESEEEQPSRRTRSGRKFSQKKNEPKKEKKQAKTPAIVPKKYIAEESEEEKEIIVRITRSGKKILAKNTEVKKQTKSKPKKEIKKEESKEVTTKKTQRKIDVTVIPQKRGRNKNDNPDPPTKKVKNPKYNNTTSEQVTQPQTPISPPAYTPCSNPCIDVGYEVEKLMHLQKIDGHWSSSSDLSDIINNLVCSKIDVTNMNDKTTTALVVAVLDEKCHDYICLWDLVAVKARRWMGKNKQSEMKLADF